MSLEIFTVHSRALLNPLRGKAGRDIMLFWIINVFLNKKKPATTYLENAGRFLNARKDYSFAYAKLITRSAEK